MDSWGLAAEIASGASIERAIVPQIGVMLGKPDIKHLAHLHEVRPFDTLGDLEIPRFLCQISGFRVLHGQLHFRIGLGVAWNRGDSTASRDGIIAIAWFGKAEERRGTEDAAQAEQLAGTTVALHSG